MSIENFDVAILGGGLAGLSAAVCLCTESSLSVALIEMQGIGANKTIRALYSEAINEFGLQKAVVQEYTKFVYHSPLGAMASFDYGKAALCGVDYYLACKILWELADKNGLETRFARATGLSPLPPELNSPIQIHLSSGDRIQAQILVDASGPSQWTARQLNINRSKLYSVCYGEHLSGCEIKDNSTFRFLAGNNKYGNGGGWFYPIQEHDVSFGYSIVVSEKDARTQLVPGYWCAKREFLPYADWVKGSKRKRIEGGVIPVGRIAKFTNDRILIIGDAGGQANSWSVEGCRPALQNGQFAARVIKNTFDVNRFDQNKLAIFEREWIKRNGERFWRTASCSDVTWHRSAEENDRLITLYQQLDAQSQLAQLRDNSASFFEQIYARGGYTRRQLMKWLGVSGRK